MFSGSLLDSVALLQQTDFKKLGGGGETLCVCVYVCVCVCERERVMKCKRKETNPVLVIRPGELKPGFL